MQIYGACVFRGSALPEEFGGDVIGAVLEVAISPERETNVVIECTSRDADVFLERGGVYVDYYRFRVDVQEVVQSCFKCNGFDDVAKDCRNRERSCRNCGEIGHMVNYCPNPAKYGNCAVRGYQADHRVTSPLCPVYAMMAALALPRQLSAMGGGDAGIFTGDEVSRWLCFRNHI